MKEKAYKNSRVRQNVAHAHLLQDVVMQFAQTVSKYLIFRTEKCVCPAQFVHVH